MIEPLKQSTIERWPAALAAAIERCGRVLHEVRIVAETNSTQDVAHALGRPAGLVVVAHRQTAGRGRLGRAWTDTGHDGVALSAVVEVDEATPPSRLVLAAALAAARIIERMAGLAVRVKWPNDLVVGSRKLAGILVERSGDRAVIGLGLNVGQSSFPPELADRATSLALEGHHVDRLAVVVELLPALDAALVEPVETLHDEFALRDALRGARACCITPQGDVEGDVLEVHPVGGVRIRLGQDERTLPGATTSIRWWKPSGSLSR